MEPCVHAPGGFFPSFSHSACPRWNLPQLSELFFDILLLQAQKPWVSGCLLNVHHSVLHLTSAQKIGLIYTEGRMRLSSCIYLQLRRTRGVRAMGVGCAGLGVRSPGVQASIHLKEQHACPLPKDPFLNHRHILPGLKGENETPVMGLKLAPRLRQPSPFGWVGKIPWRREQQPTPVFLLGELHGWRNLAGYSLGSQRGGHDWVNLFLSSPLGKSQEQNPCRLRPCRPPPPPLLPWDTDFALDKCHQD